MPTHTGQLMKVTDSKYEPTAKRLCINVAGQERWWSCYIIPLPHGINEGSAVSILTDDADKKITNITLAGFAFEHHPGPPAQPPQPQLAPYQPQPYPPPAMAPPGPAQAAPGPMPAGRVEPLMVPGPITPGYGAEPPPPVTVPRPAAPPMDNNQWILVSTLVGHYIDSQQHGPLALGPKDFPQLCGWAVVAARKAGAMSRWPADRLGAWASEQQGLHPLPEEVPHPVVPPPGPGPDPRPPEQAVMDPLDEDIPF